MDDLDDLRLDRPATDTPPARSRSWTGPLIVVAIVVAAAAIWFFFIRAPSPRDVQVRTDTTRAPENAPAARAAVPGEDIPLPPLAETDALVRELVAKLSSHPRVAAWLTTDQLIRNFTVVVTNISNGRTPAAHLKAVPIEGPFRAQESGDNLVIDPASYRRYDSHADAVAAIDAEGAARLYATLKPRIEEAYKELGNPEGGIDGAMERAIVELLKTPVIEGDVRLTRDSVAYTYADPALESLSHAQRQLLRMGPRNIRIVQAKLREIAGFLGIPEESLPPARER
jgi:hypothetical protein